ncbi:MAG: thioredoxin domain-containing protein [Candidatus Korobacteraceae bacterium]
MYLFLCAVAVAQSTVAPLSPEVAQRVQRQVRAYFNMPPEVIITIGKPGSSEFPNYETLPVTMSLKEKTQTLDFLISTDGKTLIRMMKLDLTKDVYAETMNKIKLADRPIRGNPDAKVTIVNFDDFECPFCARMHSTLMTEILPQYQDKIRIIYKDYPLVSIHPWAQHAANDANCLAKESPQGYWQLADYLHANQRTISGSQQNVQASFNELDRVTLDFGKKNGTDLTQLQACIKAQSDTIVKASMAEGDTVNVTATPTVFVNGERLEGALDANEVRAALNRELLAAGVQPPPSPPPPVPASPPAHPATPSK